MDLATIIGLIGGAGMIVMSVLTSGGSMGDIFDPPSIFMTIGGSFMALLICGPLKKTLGIFGVMGKAFKVRDFGEKTLVQNMVALSEKARREGILALEEGLEAFAGCAVVISHDRWFLDRICTHILAFEGDGNVYYYEGSYTDYEAHKLRRLGLEEPKRIRYRKLE